MSKSVQPNDRAAKAAAIRAQHDRSERNRKLGLAAAVLLALSLIGAMVWWQTQNSSPTGDLPNVTVSAGDHSIKMGKDDAQMKVVVYEDFLCPYCREFEVSARDFLRQAAKKGKVQVEYRPFHLLQDDQDYSLNTLNAFARIMAEDPQKALAFHDLAYDNQPYENAPNKPSVTDIKGWAKEVGVTGAVRGQFDSVDQTWVQAANQAAIDAKIKGTPTVLVDGKKLEGASISEMADNLEKMIADLK
ncbi:MAG TPA: thioredoxin domain-containing protein [Marmoricola sp.]|nr:thioredoxin domain-containing protein [Marmoricola sp.]